MLLRNYLGKMSNEKELLQTGITSGFKGETRRSVIKKIGLATVIAFAGRGIFGCTDQRFSTGFLWKLHVWC
jgi:hypothetical protein